MTRLFSRQDVWGGLLLVLFGAAGLSLGSALDMGTARRMGPGYFPTILSWSLIALGGLIAGRGALRSGPPVSPSSWRALLLVTLATVTFGYAIDRAGLIVATLVAVTLGAYAGRGARPVEVAALAVVLALSVVGLFVYGLGQPLPLWGR